ncbi:MFS transporter [Pedococcus sp. 5OH_020]|uniref:MFS transporter n=1 Tax=Pedococcus sp. 5OH_020 TaxID=2989814 RepID=UPI0022E9C204|nr:MFS transporter [Pedococcus sp. 5OH_020]
MTRPALSFLRACNPARGKPARVPDLPRYLLGAGLARLAVEGHATALVLLALDRTGDARTAGVLLAVLLAPSLVAGPLGGTLLDRVRRRRATYVGALAFLATCIGSLSILLGPRLGAAPILAALLAGCTLTVVSGGLSSLVPDLTRGTPSARAFGLDSIAYSAASVAGPSLAAAVASTLGAAAAVQACAVLVAVGALLVGTLDLPATAPQERRAVGLLRQTGAGLKHMVTVRPLSVVTVGSTLAFVGFGPVALATALVAGTLGHDRSAGGLALSGFAAGALLGSLLVTVLRTPRSSPELLVLGSLAATGVFLGLAGLAPRFDVMVACFALAGLVNGPGLVTTFAIRADCSPAGMRTQIFTTAASLKGAAGAVGAALGGTLAAFGARGLLVTMGSIHVLGALAGLGVALAYRSRRRRAAEAVAAVSGAAESVAAESVAAESVEVEDLR